VIGGTFEVVSERRFERDYFDDHELVEETK
jgi:limonene-1,2-epoxide hydrolase